MILSLGWLVLLTATAGAESVTRLVSLMGTWFELVVEAPRSDAASAAGEAAVRANHLHKDAPRLSVPQIPAGTRVTVINEAIDASLVSVIDTIDGNPWIVGWVDKDAVRVKADEDFVVRDDHLLATPEGRQFERIDPHINGFNQKKRIQKVK